MRKLSAAVAVAVAVPLASVVGCSSDPAPTEGCVGSGSAALKTCAQGAILPGVDVSVYQGNVNWSQIKDSGRQFAFVRISDGLNSPDTKFAQNWPAMNAVGIVRGPYQYFRPSQDAALQAQMVLDKLAAAGGLKPGDLPPVLDLESADGLASSVVVAQAKVWLTTIEATIKVKPIVYTAAFMSSVIGTNFGDYTLWVANYATTCPTMPSGWTNWHFWQNADNGNVPGISGAVDTDVFNGTLAALQELALKPAEPPKGGVGPSVGDVVPIDTHAVASGDQPNDGSQGATLGSGTPPGTTSAPLKPCQ